MKQVFLPLVSGPQVNRKTVCSRINKARNQVNLASYNIGYSTNDSWVISRDRIATIVEQLKQGHDAEVVALQEVVQRDNRPEIQVFSNDHKDWWQFTAPHNEDQDYRNLILSAYPIVKGSERTHTIKSKKGKQDRVNLSVQVAHPSGTFRVFNVHTRYDEASEGVAQTMKWVRTITDQEKGMPFVVMGDFNDSRGDVDIAAENAGLDMDITHAGRIDHILASGFKIIETCSEVRAAGITGEHDPLFATVERR